MLMLLVILIKMIRQIIKLRLGKSKSAAITCKRIKKEIEMNLIHGTTVDG